MMHTPLHPKPPPQPPPPIGARTARTVASTRDTLVSMFRTMLASRLLETRIVQLYRQNRITGGCYTGIGNEATSVASVWPMRPEDVLVPTHRDMGSHLVRGHSPLEIMLQYLKRQTSMTGGKDSGLHLGREGSNIVGMISHLAHMMPVAVGVALAERQKGTNACVLTTVGEGSTSLGDFHESLNFAALKKLPVVFVIVNNQYAYSTPNTMQYAVERLSVRAAGYGMHGETVDGTDALEVLDASERAFFRARSGDGPTLLECVTMRMRGHSEHDDFRYVPKELLAAWNEWDPIARLKRALVANGTSTDESLEALATEVEGEIDRAVDEAESAPLPDGHQASTDVFRVWRPEWTVPDGASYLASRVEDAP